jgi:exocyst complex component 1
MILQQIAPVIDAEDEFITDFLQINDAALTYADYMGLDNYFRRQAARGAGISQSTLKLLRNAMDLIFGFFPNEFKIWLDGALARDNTYVDCHRIIANNLTGVKPNFWSSGLY